MEPVPSVLIKTVPRDDESEVEVEDFTLVEDEGAMELTEELLALDEGGDGLAYEDRQERESIFSRQLSLNKVI